MTKADLHNPFRERLGSSSKKQIAELLEPFFLKSIGYIDTQDETIPLSAVSWCDDRSDALQGYDLCWRRVFGE